MTVHHRNRLIRSYLTVLAVLLVLLGPAALLTDLAVEKHYGGSATNGRALHDPKIDERYYLSSKGKLTEVSVEIWRRVLTYENMVFIVWPLSMAGMFHLVRKFVQMMVYRVPEDQLAKTVTAIRGSGPRLASFTGAGAIGTVWGSIPLVRAEIYPAGLVIWMRVFIPPIGIRAGEIRSVQKKKLRIISSGIEIAHCSQEITSPIQLDSADQRFHDALRQIIAHNA